MTMDLDALTSCAELTAEHADEAASSPASLRALLAWASEIARPGEGAPKVLMAIARLVSAEWFEGAPYVEIRGDDSTAALSVFADHGIGIRERVVPEARLRVPADEFVRAVRLAPQLVAPFLVREHEDVLVLAAPDALLEPAETIVIDEQSLYEQARTTAPPPQDGRPSTVRPPTTDRSGIHTKPTVRRMVAVRPEAFRRGSDDDD